MINYWLKLLNIINIYLIFYIFLLKLVLLEALNVLFIEIESINSNVIYDIEIILNCKYVRNKIKYLIKWLDYLYSKNIWKFKKDFNCSEKLWAFYLKYPYLLIKF